LLTTGGPVLTGGLGIGRDVGAAGVVLLLDPDRRPAAWDLLGGLRPRDCSVDGSTRESPLQHDHDHTAIAAAAIATTACVMRAAAPSRWE
jgi:hypothetical protein